MTATLQHGIELCLVDSSTACRSVQQTILMMLPDYISCALGLQMVAFACCLLVVSAKHTLSLTTAVWICAVYCQILQQRGSSWQQRTAKGQQSNGQPSKGQRVAKGSQAKDNKRAAKGHSQGQQRAAKDCKGQHQCCMNSSAKNIHMVNTNP